LIISKQRPQISLAIPICYKLRDLLIDAIMMQRESAGLDVNITHAESVGLIKYKKYYVFMGTQDAYYVASVPDPQFKQCY
jgi:hypothetical protein